MYIHINGIEIFYERYEGEGLPVVLLHGWGASVDSMRGIYNYLIGKNRNTIMLDLPGFGNSSLPDADFTIYDYANLVSDLLIALQIEKPIILGHSFGGRIAIILGSNGVAGKLVLTDAAGLKPKFSLAKKIKILKYKVRKALKLKTDSYGSADYKALSGNMKKVFVGVVNTHLDRLIKRIKVPTLIIWGENDKDTPLYMAKKLAKSIPDSGLTVIKNAGHYCFADDYVSFCLILAAFAF